VLCTGSGQQPAGQGLHRLTSNSRGCATKIHNSQMKSLGSMHAHTTTLPSAACFPLALMPGTSTHPPSCFATILTPPPRPPPTHTVVCQVTDQTYEHSDNAALLANHQSGTPVRVFRAKMLQQQEPGGRVRPVRMYVYEGLYQVIEHRSVPSQDGPLVSTVDAGGPGFKPCSRQKLGEICAMQK